MRKIRVVGAAVCMAVVLGMGGPAFAGEWSPGNDEYTPVKQDGVASSICAFSGRDEPDAGIDGMGELEPDDGLWAQTPAKGKVQSPGQLIAAGLAPPGIPGQECRGGGN